MDDLSMFSLEAEQAVIGSLLYDHAAWDRVSGVVDASHFVDHRHSLMFGAIKSLADAGRPFDGLVVKSELSRLGVLMQAGGEQYIAELIKSCPGSSNVASYAAVIRDRCSLRRVAKAVNDCRGILADPDISLAERAERAASTILDAAIESASEVDLFTIKDGLTQLYSRLEADHARGTGLAGLSTGFSHIDKRMSGLKGGELIIVAGRPSMGKTNLALNIAGHCAKGGNQVAFFSMEMSKMELSGRMAACMGGMNYGAMNGMDWEGFSGALGAFVGTSGEYTMLIDDRASQTVDRIRVGCKKAKRMMGGLKLIVVDYLQLIQAKGSSRYEQVTNISRDLKILAKEFNVPVLCLAQLNRAPADNQNKIPKASDLRDSGSIEQDADVVALIHREDNPDGTTGQYADLIFDKIRAGQRGKDVLLVDFGHCRFKEANADEYNDFISKKEAEKGSGSKGKNTSKGAFPG